MYSEVLRTCARVRTSVCVVSRDGVWCEAPQASLERATTEVDWLARGCGFRRIAQRSPGVISCFRRPVLIQK